jgi:hypothetical protein
MRTLRLKPPPLKVQINVKIDPKLRDRMYRCADAIPQQISLFVAAAIANHVEMIEKGGKK